MSKYEPQITQYTVCTHFFSAIFNGDESGLEEDEVAKLNAWLESEGFNLQYGHFSTEDGESESHFGHCEVTGEQGDVADLEWVQMRDPKTANLVEIDATYRVILFRARTRGARYVAMMWNYEEGLLATTEPHETYTGAHQELWEIALDRKVKLRWFDGEYEHEGTSEQLIPRPEAQWEGTHTRTAAERLVEGIIR